MSKEKLRNNVLDAILILLSLLLTVGTATIFQTCGPMEDGKYMACHWAGVVIVAIGVTLTVQNIVRLTLSNSDTRRGISIATLLTAILAVAIPGRIVNLCMKSDMQCQAVTKPVATVICILLIIVLIVDIIFNSKAICRRKQK